MIMRARLRLSRRDEDVSVKVVRVLLFGGRNDGETGIIMIRGGNRAGS